jgi:hypothetical protein
MLSNIRRAILSAEIAIAVFDQHPDALFLYSRPRWNCSLASREVNMLKKFFAVSMLTVWAGLAFGQSANTASGLSGIVQGPPLDFSPIQNLAEQLGRLGAMRQQADLARLQVATTIAEKDPALALKVLGDSGKRLIKTKGQNPFEKYFQNIYEQAQAREKQRNALYEATHQATQASTESQASSQAAAIEAPENLYVPSLGWQYQLPTLGYTRQPQAGQATNGLFLGNLSSNPYLPSSTSNPFGLYGSRFSPTSLINPFSQVGSSFSPNSPNNPFAVTTPKIFAQDGQYLGKLSSNPFDSQSISNPFGQYGSPFSPTSVNNPFGIYGSPYSPLSPNNPFATKPPVIIQPKP